MDQTTPKVGTILSEHDNQKDAIHFAVAPVVAAHQLDPGEHIGLLGNGEAGYCTRAIGIVDPFLKFPVNPGERFYLFLYPGTITSLRHVWTHPTFTSLNQTQRKEVEDDVKQNAMAWLQNFIDKYHFEASDYAGKGNLKKVIDSVSGSSPSLHAHGQTISSYDLDPGELDEFWEKMEIVTGQRFDQNHRENISFSCSC